MSSYAIGDAPLDWEAPPPGSALRGILALVPGVLWAFGYLFYLILVILLLRKWSERHRLGLLRGWGRGLLWIFGIRLELHGLENRDFRSAKILAVNHVSLVDLFVYSAAFANPGTLIYKREFGRIPLMGRVMRMIDFIEIDRGNREAAHKSMEQAAKRIREEGLALWIAPEGTRSRLGGLQEFKMGAFHLALQTGAPVVPCIMRGGDKVNPMGSWIVRSGTVRVDFLPPIDTSTWQRKELRDRAQEVRQLFLRFLPAAKEIAS